MTKRTSQVDANVETIGDLNGYERGDFPREEIRESLHSYFVGDFKTTPLQPLFA